MTLYAVYIARIFQNDVREFDVKPDTPTGVDLYTLRSELAVDFDPLTERLDNEVVEDHENQVRILRLKTVPKTDEELFGYPEATIQLILDQENRVRRITNEPLLSREDFRTDMIARLRAA